MAILTNMRVLVTAFEPFGGAETNISRIVMEGIREEVEKVLLPVSFRNAPLVLQQAIRDIHPDVIIMLGQCGDEEKISLERFAVNMMDSEKGDNDRFCPKEERIYEGAPVAYQTPFEVRTWVESLEAQGLPVRASNSAGLYVCNRAYYEALHHGQKAIFVHIPKTAIPSVATLTIEQLITSMAGEARV